MFGKFYGLPSFSVNYLFICFFYLSPFLVDRYNTYSAVSVSVSSKHEVSVNSKKCTTNPLKLLIYLTNLSLFR